MAHNVGLYIRSIGVVVVNFNPLSIGWCPQGPSNQPSTPTSQKVVTSNFPIMFPKVGLICFYLFNSLHLELLKLGVKLILATHVQGCNPMIGENR